MTRPSRFPEGLPGATARDVTLADGTRLRLIESGAASGAPILLVHGFGASSFQWRFQLTALAAAGFHVLAPDLPGHGFSQLTFPTGEYTREAYARRLWLLLDAIGIDHTPIVGQSMGGAVAAEMALQQPDRVRGLVLLSPVGFGTVPPRARVVRRVPDALAPLGRAFANRATARIILRDVYGPDAHWSARDEDDLLAPYGQPAIYRALLRTLKEFDFGLHSAALLARLPAGTLVVFGTHDHVVRPVDLDARLRAMRDARLMMLPRVGHLPQVEAAERVAALLCEVAGADRVATVRSAD